MDSDDDRHEDVSQQLAGSSNPDLPSIVAYLIRRYALSGIRFILTNLRITFSLKGISIDSAFSALQDCMMSSV